MPQRLSLVTLPAEELFCALSRECEHTTGCSLGKVLWICSAPWNCEPWRLPENFDAQSALPYCPALRCGSFEAVTAQCRFSRVCFVGCEAPNVITHSATMASCLRGLILALKMPPCSHTVAVLRLVPASKPSRKCVAEGSRDVRPTASRRTGALADRSIEMSSASTVRVALVLRTPLRLKDR